MTGKKVLLDSLGPRRLYRDATGRVFMTGASDPNLTTRNRWVVRMDCYGFLDSPTDQLVEPIDLPRLLADFDIVTGMLHDAEQDHAEFIDRYVRAERAEIIEIVRKARRWFRYRDVEIVDRIIKFIDDRGGAVARLSPDGYRQENERLRAALGKIVDYAVYPGKYEAGSLYEMAKDALGDS